MTALPLILASQSPARLRMLRDAGVEVEPVSTDFAEDQEKARLIRDGTTPPDLSRALAAGKALAASKAWPGRWVLGADQTLSCEGQMFDKPTDETDLRAQLATLRGRRHSLHSSAVLATDGVVVWAGSDSATLSMREFSAAFLHAYVSRETPDVLECVGGYRLEDFGLQLFDHIEGDVFTILGLPLLAVLGALRNFGSLRT